MAAPAAILTSEQVESYLDRLQLPEERRIRDVASLAPEDALSYLALLQKHHLLEIPFENLALHYSPHRTISLHPEELYRKIIGSNNGRGGYCMEATGLFAMLLRSLGFTMYTAAARVYNKDRLSGWGHMIILVKIGGHKYHVDVGFGTNGPTAPLLLSHAGTFHPHVAPAEVRLQWRNIAQNTDPDQRIWVYEHRANHDGDFVPMYCFPELEFLPEDYAVMNLTTSTSPRTFFTQMIFVEKKLVGEDGELAGSIILTTGVKWVIHGKIEREINFESEAERIKAVEEHFGITLTVVEQDSIRGLTSHIKSS